MTGAEMGSGPGRAQAPAIDEWHGNGSGPDMAGIMVELAATLGSVKQALDGDRARKPKIPWEACHPVSPQGAVVLTAGAGTFLQPDLMGPTTMYWWDLREITVWGFTAGSVTVFKNSTLGEQVAVFNTPGNFTWSGQKFLRPDDDLKVSATGITGNVQFVVEAIEIETAWLAEYLL